MAPPTFVILVLSSSSIQNDIHTFQDVIQQITGGRKKRDVGAEKEVEVEANARIANMLFRMEKKFKQMQ